MVTGLANDFIVKLWLLYAACFVLITYIGGQERLYCTHEALNVAYDNPSAFCQAAGSYSTCVQQPVTLCSSVYTVCS